MKYLLSHSVRYTTTSSRNSMRASEAIERSQYLLKNKNIKCVHNFLLSSPSARCQSSQSIRSNKSFSSHSALYSFDRRIESHPLIQRARITHFPLHSALFFCALVVLKNVTKAIKMISPSWELMVGEKGSNSCCCYQFHRFYGFIEGSLIRCR